MLLSKSEPAAHDNFAMRLMVSNIVCALQELRELKLYDNQLAAIEKIDALSDLVNLQLQHNRIQCIGRGLVNCRKLMSLRLDCNRLLRIEVKEIAALARLTQLDLSNNRLEDVGVSIDLHFLTERCLAVCPSSFCFL